MYYICEDNALHTTLLLKCTEYNIITIEQHIISGYGCRAHACKLAYGSLTILTKELTYVHMYTQA